MFCTSCGSQLKDGARYCTNCGAPISNDMAFDDTYSLPNSEGNSINDSYASPNGQAESFDSQREVYIERLQTDRSLILYIVLTYVTFGIYGYYFLYKISHDVNIACYGDGEDTPGLLTFILLSMVTCGIYAWVWYYKLGNRLHRNAPRYGMRFKEDGVTILLWMSLGSLLCGIGPLIGMYQVIRNTNLICDAYNRYNNI